MANQQERLSYLAGIIDGEGHVGLLFKRGKKVIGGIQYRPIVQVQMKSPETIDFLGKISAEIGIPHYINHASNNKSRWQVYGMKRCHTFLPMILPHLFTKSRQAELLLEFVESRLNWTYGAGITTRELEIVETLKLLNGRGESSETIRSAALQGAMR